LPRARHGDIFAPGEYIAPSSCRINAEYSGLKLMDTEGLDPQKLHGAPPLMPWAMFADWIGMGDEPGVVEAWLARGYIPTIKIGKRVMVNITLLNKDLLERE
jgi:hypothetical protein